MTASPETVFQRYRAERRNQPLAGFELAVLPHLSRYTALTPGASGFVVFADLPAGRESELIDAEVAHFAARRQHFEWKLYDLDRPASLQASLTARGFGCDEPEAFMVLPTAGWTRETRLPAEVRIERVTDECRLRDVVSVQAALYPDPFAWLFANYAGVLRDTPQQVAMYCAYVAGAPVATGWIDFPSGSSFAELHGGSVLPSQRGRGIFSALVDRRMKDAQSRGYDFVAVDAAPMSRPILIRQGFMPVCLTYPLRLRA